MKIFEHELPTPEIFKRKMVVRVALPDNYTPSQKIPFMLLHDAQNYFDTWEGAETKTGTIQILDKLFTEGFPPLALVGVDSWQDRTHMDRFTDLSPWESSECFDYLPSYTDVLVTKAGGRGDQYADFIVQKIIPFVEKRYSIGGNVQKRGIGGSSMAAMASMYIGTKYNNLFSRFSFMSPALWCFEKDFTKYLKDIAPFKDGDKIYMDIGRKETSDPAYKGFEKVYLDGAQNIYNLLKDKAPNISFLIEAEGEHNMPSISKRMAQMFRYLWN